MNESKIVSGTDWIDDDDSPEWTEEMFRAAALSFGGVERRAATGVLTQAGVRPIASAHRISHERRLGIVGLIRLDQRRLFRASLRRTSK